MVPLTSKTCRSWDTLAQTFAWSIIEWECWVGNPYYSYNQAHLVSLITQPTSNEFSVMVQYSAEYVKGQRPVCWTKLHTRPFHLTRLPLQQDNIRILDNISELLPADPQYIIIGTEHASAHTHMYAHKCTQYMYLELGHRMDWLYNYNKQLHSILTPTYICTQHIYSCAVYTTIQICVQDMHLEQFTVTDSAECAWLGKYCHCTQHTIRWR